MSDQHSATQRRGFLQFSAIAAVWLLCMVTPASAAKRLPPLLEQEVQAWLKSHPAAPTRPVTLEPSRNQGLLIPNLYLRIDISPHGEVAYLGRTIAGLNVEVNRWDLLDPRSTPRIQFLGFEVKETEASFRLLVSGRVGWTGIHVHFPRGTKPQAEDLISGLARVVDFGTDLDELQRLSSLYQSLNRRMESASGQIAAARSARDRLSAYETLADLLRDSVENRRKRSQLLNVGSSADPQLANRLSEVETFVQTLARDVVAELDAKWKVLRERLAVAETGFQARPLTLEQQLFAAQELESLARAAAENRTDYAARSSGLGEPIILQDFIGALARWRSGAEWARVQGCPWEEPLSEAKILSLLEIPAPDTAIAGEVRRCGISFLPESAVLARFERSGMGNAARAALRDPGVFRLSRMQIPELESALGQPESYPSSVGMPSAVIEAARSRADNDSGSGDDLSKASRVRAEVGRRTQEEWRLRRVSGAAEGGPSQSAAVEFDSGRVEFRVTPPDTAIYIDARFVGTGEEVSQQRLGLAIDPGMRHFEFVRPGYRSQTRSLDINPGERVTLRVQLVRD